MTESADRFREEAKINERLAEIADALPDAEIIRTDFSEWVVGADPETGEPGMPLDEYIRRFN